MPKKGSFYRELSGKGYTIRTQFDVLLWEDEGIHYVYAPALDLTGYGHTHAEAQSSFDLALEDFTDYIVNKGTMFEVLEDLGWTTNRKKKKAKPPPNEELEEENETYKNILQTQAFSKQQKNLDLLVA